MNKTFIGRPFMLTDLRMSQSPQNQEEFSRLLEQFFSFSIPKSYTAKQLAVALAKRTRFLRDQVITEELRDEEQNHGGNLLGFYQAFRDHLITSLTTQDFANLYAQTITYGLFAARSRAGEEFNRKLAYDNIPPTIGILRDVFNFISFGEIPPQMEWMIDDIADVLSAADLEKIMEAFYKEGKGRDPIVHFYETFLAEYDPKEREKRGVYYTPESVVNYIVRSIHKLLKEKFNKKVGFADTSVIVLDPAAGTLSFPVEAINVAVDEYKKRYGTGGIKSLIKEHILRNFYAFELMMAPYAVGHLKIGFVLNELGYKLGEDERFNLYLTNALEFTKEDPSKLPGIFEKTIAKESAEALGIKENVPVMIIIGNPPYSVSSSNIIKEGSSFYKLYESYKEKVRKEERNIQPLSDDYIKFIAFAHWKIEQTGHGIVGMITNNSYLDGLIHRDMREKLFADFNEIYILNLHGNAKRQEKTPEGEKDENVFDIQQGVSVILLVKNGRDKHRVKYADVWGLRDDKYKFLDTHDVTNTIWNGLQPKEKQYFFVKKDFKKADEYRGFISLKDIFIKNNAGIATGKDKVLVDFDKNTLLRRLDVNDKSLFELNMQHSKVGSELINKWYAELANTNIEDQVLSYSYRPFDTRYVVYNKRILQRARDKIMVSFLRQNLGLITTKQLSTNNFHHAFVSDTVSDRCLISLQTREVSYVFPLYILRNSDKQGLLEDTHKSSNLRWDNLGWLQTLQPFTSRLSNNFIQVNEAIFYYIYAVLYSNTYRQEYQEFLKIDFPRIPFTKDYTLFRNISELGEQLVNLHLLKSEELDNLIAKFYGEEGNRVEKREYVERKKRIHINESQYFEGIKAEVWNYNIGGYQVLDKWLKDRQIKKLNRGLNDEEIRHYLKIITTISKTIEIQKEIDKLYPKIEKELIEFC